MSSYKNAFKSNKTHRERHQVRITVRLSSMSVVLNLFVATEPLKLYQWLTEPLIVGKIKYYLIYQRYIFYYCTK